MEISVYDSLEFSKKLQEAGANVDLSEKLAVEFRELYHAIHFNTNSVNSRIDAINYTIEKLVTKEEFYKELHKELALAREEMKKEIEKSIEKLEQSTRKDIKMLEGNTKKDIKIAVQNGVFQTVGFVALLIPIMNLLTKAIESFI